MTTRILHEWVTKIRRRKERLLLSLVFYLAYCSPLNLPTFPLTCLLMAHSLGRPDPEIADPPQHKERNATTLRFRSAARMGSLVPPRPGECRLPFISSDLWGIWFQRGTRTLVAFDLPSPSPLSPLTVSLSHFNSFEQVLRELSETGPPIRGTLSNHNHVPFRERETVRLGWAGDVRGGDLGWSANP